MAYAIAKREMQFVAGPQHHTFYACQEHVVDLETGEVSCFLILADCPVVPIEETEEPCWFCREG